MNQAWRLSRAQRAGKLAEEFCEEHFGIEEDDKYEIKSSSYKNYQIIVKSLQLLKSHNKQYVICRHQRERRKLSRGPRKGQWVYSETIEKAYKKKLDVYVIRGKDLLEIVISEKCPLRKTSWHNDGEWAYYWLIKIRMLEHLPVYYEDEKVRIFALPEDPPRWMVEPEVEEEVPF